MITKHAQAACMWHTINFTEQHICWCLVIHSSYKVYSQILMSAAENNTQKRNHRKWFLLENCMIQLWEYMYGTVTVAWLMISAHYSLVPRWPGNETMHIITVSEESEGGGHPKLTSHCNPVSTTLWCWMPPKYSQWLNFNCNLNCSVVGSLSYSRVQLFSINGFCHMQLCCSKQRGKTKF